MIKPIFTRKGLGEKLFPWVAEVKTAWEAKSHFGFDIVPSDDEYIVFKMIGKDFCIVAYPHRTSAMNYHLRLRDENSKNPQSAFDLIDHLDAKTGLNCTFRMSLHGLTNLRRRIKERRETL
jgi:hypothetical protein